MLRLFLVAIICLGCGSEDGKTVIRFPGANDGAAGQNTAPDAAPIPTGDAAVAASCTDGLKNGDESDTDCGGSCSPCTAGQVCAERADCASSVCAEARCAAARCDDGLQNGDETDTDCGGECDPCEAGGVCTTAEDCASQVCTDGTCIAPTCDDGAHNGDESDADCGGGCDPCANGAACTTANDCHSRVCRNESCAAPTCEDGVANGDESDVDCGGGCDPCASNEECNTHEDCQDRHCVMGLCAAARCDDGIQNGQELGVDCGGACGRCDLAGLDCDAIDMMWPERWTAFEDAVLTLTNEQRAQGANCDSRGRFGRANPLVMEPRLRCAARRHSDDMAVRGFYDHVNPDGASPGDRIDATGYRWRAYAENIYQSPDTPQEAIDGWVDSDGHCANLMNPDFTQIGIGYSENAMIVQGTFWTQNFGIPR